MKHNALQLQNREQIRASRRWVVKIGSALLTGDGAGVDAEAILDWVGQIVALREQGVEVVLVSSGAVAEGMSRLGWRHRPEAVDELQAAAAVGQMGLVQTWQSCFQQHQVLTAQVLLTHDDLSDRKRYLNSRSSLLALLRLGVVPVVNENDSVVTDEIRFGDNDTLAALVANLIQADLLVILTDQAGLYDADPRVNANASLIHEGRANEPRFKAMASGGAGVLGRGGMATKVAAAELAARSGAATLIAGGRQPGVLTNIYAGQQTGTLLTSDQEPLAARKHWLAGHLQMRGTVQLDDGAVSALQQKGVSLLPVGINAVDGDFARGDMVACLDKSGQRIACGLVNYNAEEARKIVGLASGAIPQILGYRGDDELIHRDNMVVF